MTNINFTHVDHQIHPKTMWQICLILGLWILVGNMAAGITLLVVAALNFKAA